MEMTWQSIERLFGDRLRRGLPLRDFTTLGIGGPAAAMIVAGRQEELVAVVRLAKQAGIPFLLLGGGSNLLVADEGVATLVVKNEARGIGLEDGLVVVQAGTALQDLVDFTLAQGLAGLQRLTGIPGTVGGAVYGNAGAYGQSIADHLVEVTCFDGQTVRRLSRDDCRFAYRASAFKHNGCVILEARLRLARGDPQALAAEANEIRRQRLAKYPVDLKCPGSFSMNVLAERLPPQARDLIPADKVIHGKVPAGFLLEQVGAKGQARGGIRVSEVSANLFLNVGGGTAADLLTLAMEQARKVKERFGVELEPEVQLVNLPQMRLS